MPLIRSAAIGFVFIAATVAAQTTQSSSSQKTSSAQTQAQSQPQSPSQGDASTAVSLDRIREGIMRDPRIELPDFGLPTYRVEVSQPTIKLPGEYDKPDAVGAYVRGPYFSNLHQDFLNMSSPTGRPSQTAGGIPVVGLISALKKGFREREAARVRAQIQSEMQDIDPARFQPVSTSTPGSRSPE